MNRIQDLEAQNLCDCRSLFYLFMAKSALADGSIKSEEKLRRTVRRYGELMGTAELEAHQKRGFKPNLLNFYTKSRYHCEDPRLVCECQRLNEQTALFNVVRCPFAHCAALYNMQKEAKIFCEEYTAACIEAYTGKVAQVNVSEVLTEPRNTHCRIASYCRPGNIPGDCWHKYFDSFMETCQPDDAESENPDAHEALAYSSRMMLTAFVSGSVDEKTAVSGIRTAGEAIASFLKNRATCMEQKVDGDFLSRNCPFDFETMREDAQLAPFAAAFDAAMR